MPVLCEGKALKRRSTKKARVSLQVVIGASILLGQLAQQPPTFEPPSGFYWASRRHKWLPTPIGVEVLESQ